jgi:plastocyanin
MIGLSIPKGETMRVARLAAVCGLAVVISCGGGDSSPTGADNGGTPPPPSGGVNIEVRDYSFTPDSLTIKVGTTVQWVNQGPSTHHVVSDNGVWDAGQLTPPSGDGGDYGGGPTYGETYQFKFDQAGTYRYHCANHPLSAYPNFKGVIVVTP